MGNPSTTQRVKQVIRASLKLAATDPLEDSMPLMGGDYDLDSLDVLLVVTNIEKEFGIKIADRQVGRQAFATVATLAAFVDEQLAAK